MLPLNSSICKPEEPVVRRHPICNKYGVLSSFVLGLSQSWGEPMPPTSRSGNTRASPRFAFDALAGVVVSQADKPRQFWSRSSNISQGGIGLNLIGGDVKPEEHAFLQIHLPKQLSAGLRASLRYRIGLHCGFEFVDLSEDQRTAIRTACDALPRSNSPI